MKENLSDQHILFLARWYPNRHDPMPGLFIRYHAQLVAHFAKVSVLYLHSENRLDRLFELVKENDQNVMTYKVYYRTIKTNIFIISNIAKAIRFLRAFFYGYKAVKKDNKNISLIHVHVLTRLGIVALFLKIFKQIPYVITEHWSRYLASVGTYKGTIRKFFTRMVVKNAKAITTPTENLKNAMIGFNLDNPNYIILPNVVDTERFAPGKKEPDTSRKIRMVHVSCFEDRSKNISGIINVLKQLAQQRNDWECIMIGEGEDYGNLKSMADDMGLYNEFIFFTGLLEGENLVKEYQKADFLLMFSNYENLPVVINEAFSCGIPVISSNVGGIGEVVNDERGILVKPNDNEGLLVNLNYLLDNIEKYDREKIRSFAVQNFSASAVENQLYNMYTSILQENN